MAMVGRATGPSLSSAVVAAGLGGVQACGGHCANHSRQCIAANGLVLVNENKPSNMCVSTEQLEFSFHDIFNNTFRQGFAAGELILPIILRSAAHLSFKSLALP